jgi:hypothetical protein
VCRPTLVFSAKKEDRLFEVVADCQNRELAERTLAIYAETPGKPQVAPTKIPECARPNKEGLYLCRRADQRPEVAEIREHDGELWFFSCISYLPLSRLEAAATFYGPINL